MASAAAAAAASLPMRRAYISAASSAVAKVPSEMCRPPSMTRDWKGFFFFFLSNLTDL
jgi:hypothetical protein